jgi:DNA helicase-2/ATP-dependent DNA helicase PcrA
MTAMTAPPNEKDPKGGDYWRQMVFYKLLLERYEERSRKVILGMFDYLQPNSRGEYKQVVVPVFAQDEEVVLHQLKDSYASIMNHEFDTGCGKDDCHWCNFVKRYNIVRPPENDIVEIDDV